MLNLFWRYLMSLWCHKVRLSLLAFFEKNKKELKQTVLSLTHLPTNSRNKTRELTTNKVLYLQS